jgi:hypothetical protein
MQRKHKHLGSSMMCTTVSACLTTTSAACCLPGDAVAHAMNLVLEEANERVKMPTRSWYLRLFDRKVRGSWRACIAVAASVKRCCSWYH